MEAPDDPRRRAHHAYRFILLLGLVSLFADATYESARSIQGQFLATLGATGASVGLIAGLGELLNHALRVFSGYLSDKTRRPWRLTLFGFSLNMLAVPLLALAATELQAAVLSFAERTGKAIRNPPRDAMLASAARCVGDGRGFGLQEALGQIGAVVGPLLIGALLARGYGYRTGLAILSVPAALTLVVLFRTRAIYPEPDRWDVHIESREPRGGGSIPRTFFWLLGGGALIACGYIDFALIGYALAERHDRSAATIPQLYALAMATQALASLGIGRLFDRRPTLALVLACVIALPVPALAFQSGRVAPMIAMALWGMGVGAQKVAFKATISSLVPAHRRALAYGAFFAAYGLSWFVGSLVAGRLYDLDPGALVVVSVGAQVLAVPLLVRVGRHVRPHAVPTPPPRR